MNVTKIFQDSPLSRFFTLVSTEKQLKNKTLELIRYENEKPVEKLIFTKSGRFYHTQPHSWSINSGSWNQTTIKFSVPEITTIKAYIDFVKKGAEWWQISYNKKVNQYLYSEKIKKFSFSEVISQDDYEKLKSSVDLFLTMIKHKNKKIRIKAKLLTYEGFINSLDKRLKIETLLETPGQSFLLVDFKIPFLKSQLPTIISPNLEFVKPQLVSFYGDKHINYLELIFNRTKLRAYLKQV